MQSWWETTLKRVTRFSPEKRIMTAEQYERNIAICERTISGVHLDAEAGVISDEAAHKWEMELRAEIQSIKDFYFECGGLG